jgi:hypothetical protein
MTWQDSLQSPQFPARPSILLISSWAKALQLVKAITSKAAPVVILRAYFFISMSLPPIAPGSTNQFDGADGE